MNKRNERVGLIELSKGAMTAGQIDRLLGVAMLDGTVSTSRVGEKRVPCDEFTADNDPDNRGDSLLDTSVLKFTQNETNN